MVFFYQKTASFEFVHRAEGAAAVKLLQQILTLLRQLPLALFLLFPLLSFLCTFSLGM